MTEDEAEKPVLSEKIFGDSKSASETDDPGDKIPRTISEG